MYPHGGSSSPEKTGNILICSEQRAREAWGEFANPRENDPNKMAEGRKDLLIINPFRSIPVHSEGRGNV